MFQSLRERGAFIPAWILKPKVSSIQSQFKIYFEWTHCIILSMIKARSGTKIGKEGGDIYGFRERDLRWWWVLVLFGLRENKNPLYIMDQHSYYNCFLLRHLFFYPLLYLLLFYQHENHGSKKGTRHCLLELGAGAQTNQLPHRKARGAVCLLQRIVFNRGQRCAQRRGNVWRHFFLIEGERECV